jgi:gas vesicle protein
MGSTGKAFALLVGLAAGAALTVFAFSKKGKKTREEIARKFNEITDGVKTSVRKSLTKVS